MSLTSTTLVLLSAAIHVTWNYLAKSSVNPRNFFAVIGLPIVLMALALPLFINVGELPADVLRFALFSGLVHAFYFFALGSAYANSSVSFVYPIVRSAPAFVPIGAFYLIGETISGRGIVGIAIVVVSILLLQRAGDGGGDSAEAFNTSRNNLGLIWALITLALVVTYTLLDKAGMVAFNQSAQLASIARGPVYFLLQGFVTYIIYWIVAWLRGVRINDIPRADWLKGSIAGVCVMLSYSLILFVMQNEKVSYVVTLRQSSMLIATLVGWLVLKESGGLTRFGISILLALGLVLVAIAE